MATVLRSIIDPDVDAIKAHLEALFAPCRDAYPAGLIELRYGSQAPNQTAYFNVRPEGVEEAAGYAANRNREGANVYVGANPRKPSTRGAGEDTDVAIAFWQFADLDDADAVEMAGKRLKALPPTMTVTTGTEPHRRPHFYWRLDEPVGNMPAWTERQRGIAQSLDGDSVINPSRIMRLAGTVNFPPPHKLQRGYRVELTSLRTTYPDERGPVSPEQIAAAYSLKGQLSESVAQIGDGQTTLSSMRRTQIGDLLAACVRGDQWHNTMVRLVAHMASTGRSSAEILALAEHITLPGYSADQTRREMDKALQGARIKWALPEPEDDVASEETKREEASTLNVVDAFDFIEAEIPVRPWLIPGVVLSGYTHMLAAPGGSGKSLFTLQLAIALAQGQQWGAFIPRRKARTLIINAEDDLHEQRRRLSAARHVMDADAAALRGYLHLVDSSDSIIVASLDPARRSIIATPIVAKLREYVIANKIDVLIVDPFAETFEGDENDNSEVKWAMRIWRDEIARPCGCAVYLVHHTTKYASNGAGDANVIRGGGAIVNSTRISATLMPMTADEATAIGIEPAERHMFVRYDDAKANQSLKTNTARWFRKESVTIGNGHGVQEADEVGALVPWAPPDAFDGISGASIRIALERVHRGLENAEGRPTGERYTLRKRGACDRRWAGNPVVETFGVEPGRADSILQAWLKNGLIAEEIYDDPVQRKPRTGLVVDMTGAMQIGGA